MKKKIALLLLLVGAILEAKSFSSRSSSRSFSSPSRSSSSTIKTSTRSSSSSTIKVSSPRPSSSSTIHKSTPKSSSTTTNTRKSSTANTNVNKSNTTIINNNTNINNSSSSRGGGLDLVDYIILDSIVNKPRAVHTTETVYVETPYTEHRGATNQIESREHEQQVIQTKTVVKKEKSFVAGFLELMIYILLIAIVFVIVGGLFL